MMRPMSRLAFLSHASADADLAVNICESLESRGVSCWIAPRDVSYADTYGPAIERGVRESEVFVILVSAAADQSDHVQRETVIAVETHKRIIPIMVKTNAPGPRLSYWLAGWQRFVCPTAPDAQFFESLAAAVRNEGAPAAHVRTQPPRKFHRGILLGIGAAILLVGGYSVSHFLRDSSTTNPQSPPAATVQQPTTTVQQPPASTQPTPASTQP